MILSKIYNAGVDDNDSYLLAFRTRIINLLTYLVSIFFLFWAMAFIIKKNIYFAGFYMMIQMPLLSVIYLNTQRRFRVATYISFISTMVITAFSLIHFGYGVQSQFFFPFLAILVFIIYERKIDWVINLGILLVSFFTSSYFLFIQDPLSESLRFTYDSFINISFSIFGCSVFSILLIRTMMNYVTETKDSNLRLLKSNHILQEQNKIIETQKNELELFTSMASHDLKTPVRTINSFLSLIERKIDDNDKITLKRYLSFAQSGALQLNKLIEGISAYKQLDENLNSNQITNPNDIISELENILITNERQDIQISVNELSSVKVNETHLLHLLQNIIENGIKYNQNKVKRIRISDELDETHYTIKVADNGIGIESDYSNYIFQPFKKLHSSEQYESTGIGLSICKKIMNIYDGRIAVDSTLGEGSVFSLSFPKSVMASPSE